jgi:hypothetical protein
VVQRHWHDQALMASTRPTSSRKVHSWFTKASRAHCQTALATRLQAERKTLWGRTGVRQRLVALVATDTFFL